MGDARTSLAIFFAGRAGAPHRVRQRRNLLLAQAATRPREIAIRTILGAGRRRLVRQLLTESLVLALAGGAGGILVAAWILNIFRGTLPEAVPRLNAIGLDGWVVAFVAAISLLTGLTFGLAPACRTANADLNSALAGASRVGRGSRRAPRALVTGGRWRWCSSSAPVCFEGFVTLRTPARLQSERCADRERHAARLATAVQARGPAPPGAFAGAAGPTGRPATSLGRRNEDARASRLAVGGAYFKAMGIRDGCSARIPAGAGRVASSANRWLTVWPGRVSRPPLPWGEPDVRHVADVKQDGLRQGRSGRHTSVRTGQRRRRWPSAR